MPEHAHEASSEPNCRSNLVLFRIHVEALVAVLGPRKAERYLKVMAELMAREACLAEVLPLRPTASLREQRVAVRQAALTFHECLPAWVARLPPA